jgi:CRP-like cAMP-binding protein
MLSADEYRRLRLHMEPVALPRGEILSQPDETIRYVYFPHRATISVVAVMQDGAEVEAGIIGGEGMSGLPIVLGMESVPLLTMVQIPGDGTRMRADVLRAESERGGQLHHLILRYAQAFFVQTAMTAACNRLHRLDERLSRWLLMCQDRTKSAELELTHEFMAVMLGVRRAGVTEALGSLQRAGLLTMMRGQITILNRAGLEESACECYGVITREFARLGDAPPPRRAEPLLVPVRQPSFSGN